MNEFVEISELQTEARRLLRCRVPLILAVLVNFVLLIRVPLARMLAETPAAPASMATTADGALSPLTFPATPHAISQAIELTEAAPLAAVQAAASSGSARGDELATPLPDWVSEASTQESPMQQCLTHWLAEQSQPGSLPDATAAPVDLPHTAPADASAVPSMPVPADSPATAHTDAPPAPQPIPAASAPHALTLRNARDNGGPVSFLVNGRIYELLPGEAHEFSNGESWDVQFHRGESFGDERRQLACGVYRFVVTEHGWDLESVAP